MLAACGDPGLEMMPTVSMACMQQKFFIPFSAGYGTFHQSSGEAERLHRLQNSVTRRPVQFRLAPLAASSRRQRYGQIETRVLQNVGRPSGCGGLQPDLRKRD